MKAALQLDSLIAEAGRFAITESDHDEPTLFGVTDGKAVGTYLEHKFQERLKAKYFFEAGSSAKGIDFPELRVDMKVTSVKQPQSSSPFESARQKVRGLGYSLLVFVYEKQDDATTQSSRLNILHTLFIDKSRTGDYQMTRGVRDIITRDGNVEDLVALMLDRNLPIDDIEAEAFAAELIRNPPNQGYLTISNALQWRLQYTRVIGEAGKVEGINRVI